MGGQPRHQTLCGILFIEPLLKIVKRAYLAARLHDEFAVYHPLKINRLGEIRKGSRYIFAFAGKYFCFFTIAGDLNANSIPLPLGNMGLRLDRREVLLFINGMGQHHRQERDHIAHVGKLGFTFQPREELRIRRRQPVPARFNDINVDAFHFGQDQFYGPR